MAPSLKTFLGAAMAAAGVLAASATTGAAAAPASCFTPFDEDLLGRTFTAGPAGGCVRPPRHPSTYVTVTSGRITYDELNAAGARLRSTVLTYGRSWAAPTIATIKGGRGGGGGSEAAGVTPAAPWGATNRRAFVEGLSRMVRGVDAMARGGCGGGNASLGGVVAFLRVLAYQYALPAAAGVCTA